MDSLSPILDHAAARDREERDRNRELASVQRGRDWMTVLSTPEGRRLVWTILGECGLYRSSFAVDALAMAHNEGRRDVALRLLADITQHTPDAYVLMLTENRTDAA